MDMLAETKAGWLEKTAEQREMLRKQPRLQQLFLELTLRCNERCLHCGSSCGDVPCPEVSKEDYRKLLRKIRQDFSGRLPMLCITGGEPMLRKDFFDITEDAKDLGFSWGMTSNATLIDDGIAGRLYRAGMKTISVSLDGLPETHDAIRGRKGAYAQAMRGIRALAGHGGFTEIQVTTVINHDNIRELEALYETLVREDIDSWRIVAMEPIGRALHHPELLLTGRDHIRILEFIRTLRTEHMPVTYGCCHYLGTGYEREVRDWFFMCQAGLTIAGIMCNGDIGACLNIPRNPRTIQGNIYRDDFTEVWNSRYQIFRTSPADLNAECRECPHRRFCDGGSRHSWDYETDSQLVCLRGTAFSDPVA